MIKYLEFRIYNNNRPLLIKLDSIKEVSVDGYDNVAIVNGIKIKESYEEVKKLICQEERRTAYELSLQASTKALMRNSIWQLIKDLGEEQALLMIRDILDNCYSESDWYDIEKKYYDQATNPTK